MTERHYTAHQDYPPEGLWHLELTQGDHRVAADCEPKAKVATRDYLERKLDDLINPPPPAPGDEYEGVTVL